MRRCLFKIAFKPTRKKNYFASTFFEIFILINMTHTKFSASLDDTFAHSGSRIANVVLYWESNEAMNVWTKRKKHTDFYRSLSYFSFSLKAATSVAIWCMHFISALIIALNLYVSCMLYIIHSHYTYCPSDSLCLSLYIEIKIKLKKNIGIARVTTNRFTALAQSNSQHERKTNNIWQALCDVQRARPLDTFQFYKQITVWHFIELF